MHQPTSGITGPHTAAPSTPTVAARPSGRLARLVVFGLGMIGVIGAAAALPLWLLG